MRGRADPQREILDVESVAGHLLPAGGVFAFLAAHRRELFPEEMFADLFKPGGRPSVPAEVIASVIVLQTLNGFSDAEAVEAVTFDLRWKAACGLAVTAGGFHPTTLTVWRGRLRRSQRPNRILRRGPGGGCRDRVLTGKTRRALDSTILDDAVATQDTVTQLIAAIRRVARSVPGASEVIAQHCQAHNYTRAGKPMIAWDDAAGRVELVDALVADAHRVLGHLPEQELDAAAADAVALTRRCSPLFPCPGGVLMGSDAAGVDAEGPLDVPDRVVFDDHLVENALPGAVLGPDPQSLVRGLPGPVALGQVAPRGPGAQLPQDRVDHLAVVTALTPTALDRWQQRLDPRPGLIGQLATPHHRCMITEPRSDPLQDTP